MSLFVNALKIKAERTARRAGLAAFAGLICVVGLAFLGGAGFILIAEATSPIEACLYIGGSFLILGLLIFFIMSLTKPKTQSSTAAQVAAPQSPLALIIEAVIAGIIAGRAGRR